MVTKPKPKIKPKTKPKARNKKEVGKVHYPKISIIGIGGGGGSIVSEIAKNIRSRKIPHLDKIKFIVANVDFQAIKNAPKQTSTFYFGKEFTHGLGCGMRPDIGEKAALASRNRIEKILRNNDVCIFISSLGGGAGSGATPVFVSLAKDLGIPSIGIFTKPFSFEGKERANIAQNSLRALKVKLSSITIIPNQKIFKIVDKSTTINKSLSAMNKVLVDILDGLIETLYLPGLINLDFSDFQAMLDTDKSLTYLNSQTFAGRDRAEKSVESVLNNPLINYDIKGADRILFNIAGSKDLRMSEVASICEKVASFNPMARIIFGVGQDNRYKNKLKITLMAVGCEKENKKKNKKKNKKVKKEIEKSVIEKEEAPIEQTIEKKKRKIKKIVKKKQKPKPNQVLKKTEKIEKTEKVKKEIKPNKDRIEIINNKENSGELEEEKGKETTVRRNALDLHKKAEEDIQKMLEEESKWDIPTFLRGNENK